MMNIIGLLVLSTVVVAERFTPLTSSDLMEAIKKASSGDLIELLPQDYEGDFVLVEKAGPGKGSPPVILMGTNSLTDPNKVTTIIGRKKTLEIFGVGSWEVSGCLIISEGDGVVVNGSRNVVKGMVIKAANHGVIINGNDNLVSALTVRVGASGVLVKGFSNAVKSISFQGLKEFGIVVEDGSGGTEIRSVSTNMEFVQSRSLVLKKGSGQTLVYSSSFDGIADIISNGNEIKSCSFQGAGVNIFGCGNFIKTSSIRTLFVNDSCGSNFNRFENSVFNKVGGPFVYMVSN